MSILNVFVRAASLLVFALASSMVHAQSARADMGAKSSGTSAPSGNAGASLSVNDKKMMRDLAQDNTAEIDIAKLAQQRSKDPKVLAFAQKMIDDHTKAESDLSDLAQSKGVTLPTDMDTKHQAMEQKLSKLSGDAFDRQYLRQSGVTDHKQAVALLERISKQASDPELKAFADKTLPVVEQHLHIATQDAAQEKSH